jgi:hypothetical protein
MAHAYNPSYSGGRDQKDLDLKPAWANKTLSRKTLHKKGLVEWLKMKALSLSPSTLKKKM